MRRIIVCIILLLTATTLIACGSTSAVPAAKVTAPQSDGNILIAKQKKKFMLFDKSTIVSCKVAIRNRERLSDDCDRIRRNHSRNFKVHKFVATVRTPDGRIFTEDISSTDLFKRARVNKPWPPP